MEKQRTLKYCPQLNLMTGSVTASLLMCQLEYWFDKTSGKAFYKFLEPCQHGCYKLGDSWTEELGFSKAEFRSAFSHIGKSYKSRQAYLLSLDPFGGMPYLSYYDRLKKVTYYKRNHNYVKQLLRDQQCELGYYKDYKSHTLPSTENKDYLTAEQVLALFQKLCPSLKDYAHLTKRYRQRLNQLLDMLKQKGMVLLDTLEQAFSQVEASDFLCGRISADKPWRAYLEWVIRPDKFFAILSGKYAPFTPTSSCSTSPTQAITSPSTYSHPVTASTTSATHLHVHPTTPSATYPTHFNTSPSTHPVSPSLSNARPRRTVPYIFDRVESHNFDIAALEAKEWAHQQALYAEKLAKTT